MGASRNEKGSGTSWRGSKISFITALGSPRNVAKAHDEEGFSNPGEALHFDKLRGRQRFDPIMFVRMPHTMIVQVCRSSTTLRRTSSRKRSQWTRRSSHPPAPAAVASGSGWLSLFWSSCCPGGPREKEKLPLLPWPPLQAGAAGDLRPLVAPPAPAAV